MDFEVLVDIRDTVSRVPYPWEFDKLPRDAMISSPYPQTTAPSLNLFYAT